MLTIRLDYNTKSYGQWFYFNVKRKEKVYSFSRTEKNLYKFMIINMTKSTSMFGDGLKIFSGFDGAPEAAFAAAGFRKVQDDPMNAQGTRYQVWLP